MASRVWERFLTEKDKAHLELQGRRPVSFGSRPALLLIDLYRGVFGDHAQELMAGTREWPGHCGMAGWNALPHIQALLAAARASGIPIIHATGLGDAGIDGWSERVHGARGAVHSPVDVERRKRRYDIMDEVAPIPGEACIRKSAPSAFWGTPLIAHLNSMHVDTIITCGESTSGCVRASVVDGCTYGYRMIVVEECVFDRHEASHAINLFDMHQKYADVLPLAEVLKHVPPERVADMA